MEELWQKIYKVLGEHKVENLVCYDVSQICSFTSQIIICTGSSDRQLAAVAGEVIDKVGKPAGSEGLGGARWVLLDYVGTVVHFLLEEERAYYDLDGLWAKAPRLSI